MIALAIAYTDPFLVYTASSMLRNITLSAEEQVIARARDKAGASHTTLNVEFRKWLAGYAGTQDTAAAGRFRDVMSQLGAVDAGRSFTRDEMNER